MSLITATLLAFVALPVCYFSAVYFVIRSTFWTVHDRLLLFLPHIIRYLFSNPDLVIQTLALQKLEQRTPDTSSMIRSSFSRSKKGGCFSAINAKIVKGNRLPSATLKISSLTPREVTVAKLNRLQSGQSCGLFSRR